MNRQVIKKRIRKILAYTITSIVFLLISAFLVLQIPVVQETLIDRYLSSFSKMTGFPSSIGSFRLLWFDRLELDDVTIYDPEKNEMIAAKKILVNFKLTQLLSQQDINIDGVFLDDAKVYVTNIAEGDTSRNLNINVFVHQIQDNYGGSGRGTGRTPRINIGEAVLNASDFSYVDQYRDSIKTGFNYNQFTFHIDEAQLNNFLILGDTTQFNVATLLGSDQQTSMKVKELSTFFRLSQASMEFTDLSLRANDSFISDSIVFTFNGQEQLSDFIDKVKIHARLENTVLQPRDLALFAPEVAAMTQPIKLNGIFNGHIDNFKVTAMELSIGNTLLRGSLDMEGLPDISETFIILDLKNSHLDFNDLAFVVNDDVIERLTPMGHVNLSGQFLGYPHDFVANGNFQSKLGSVTSDINFKVNEKDFDKSVYSGTLTLNDFDFGTYLNDTINYQRVSLNGKVKGSGLTKRTADFMLNGKVSSIGIRGYNYSNIETNARFASELFKGFLKINDPNLELETRGEIDLREDVNTIALKTQIDTAYLSRLLLTDKDVFIHSSIDINSKGLDIDSLVGTADINDLMIRYEGQQLSLPHVRIESQKDGDQRVMAVESTLVDAQMKGDFLLTNISRDIQKLVHEILLNVRNDEEEIRTYYATENYRPKSYESNFKVDIKDIDPIADLLKLNLLLSNHTKVEGKFTSGYTTILQAFAHIDSVAYNNKMFLNTEAEITASKIADSTSVLAMAFLNSDRQILTSQVTTKNLVIEGIWNKNHIEFGFDADQEGETNYVRMKGEVDFLKDSTQLRFLPSTMNLLKKDWNIDEKNQITIRDRAVDVQHLRFHHKNEYVRFDGALSEDPSSVMTLLIGDLDLSIFNPITGKNLKGTLDARFDVSNAYGDPTLQNELTIDSLTINDFLVGNVDGKNQWDTLNNKFDINFFIDRHQKRIVNVTGLYTPARENNPLDITARLENANLKIIEPFFDDFFSHLGGSITGDYRISGKLASPAIVGEGEVKNGQIMVNYLKTLYQFTGKVGLSPNSIYFKDIELSDQLNNKGHLSGTITHQEFRDTRINIDADFQNLHILNTNEKDNSLFFGQGYATGDLNIFGPVNNLKFTANARTDKNTRISIPFDEAGDVEQGDYIKFVSFTDSAFVQTLKDKVAARLDLTGITLDFNIDVTPDAYCEIILDRKAGDIISGRGKGDIQLQLDTKGEFNMFGPFQFTEGGYNFTLYGLVNKYFEIKKGSRITWYGDPYTGSLDIEASYNQQASFGPVQVLLDVTGPMLTPDIKFDIVTKDLPQSIVINNEPVRLQFEFQSFKNKIDEQELNRQVFSLIILKRFSPPESFNTSGSIVNSVSELLSNQLANFLSQVDENLEIDVDLNTFDQETYNTFQLRLSYTFLNGRLRITRDGTFYGNQNNNNAAVGSNPNNQATTLAGDWTVDYLLTADGKLKVKMYNRTNINPILNSIGSSNSVTTGVSLSHTQSFNELKDLIKSSKKRQQQQSQQQPQPEGTNKDATKKEEDGGE